jgi:capsular polysaccharide transport system ATP-binding protein
MIELQDVSVTFQKQGGMRDVLRNVSATFEPRVNTGILATRGAGKTTLIRLLTRLQAPHSGRIVHSGSVSWPMTTNRTLLRTVSVRKNISFIASLYRSPVTELIQRVDMLAGLGPMLDSTIAELPREVAAAATYCMCLALGFDYYCTDEGPFIGSPEFRKRAAIYLEKMRYKRSLIIATRHPAIIREHCDVAYILHAGTLRRYDDPKEAIRDFKRL